MVTVPPPRPFEGYWLRASMLVRVWKVTSQTGGEYRNRSSFEAPRTLADKQREQSAGRMVGLSIATKGMP